MAPMIYHTLTAAAFAALRLAAGHTLADHHEWAGVIVQSPAGYTVTAPARGEETRFRLVVRLAPGQHIAAIYHTHPADGPAPGRFSPQDVQIANQLAVPSFIWVQARDEVREYDPRTQVAGAADFFQGSADGFDRGTLLTKRIVHNCYRDYIVACPGA